MPAYKDKKRGTWYANFYYTDWTGERKHKCKRGFKREKDAKQYEQDFLSTLKTNSDIPFNTLVEKYLEDCSLKLKESTFTAKKHLIEKKILPFFGNTKICDITPLAVSQWQNTLLSYKDENGRNYRPTTLKSINNQLSAIMNYAVKYYGLAANPCKAAGSIGKSRAGEMQIWTKEEYEHAISFEKKPYYKVAYDILFYSGIREGELLALTPADILPDMSINIDKTFVVIKGERKVTPPKTPRSTRNVSIPEFLYKEIQEYIRLLYGIQPDERLFTFTKGGLTTEFKKLIGKSGLPEIRIHDLRHSHASMLINIGINLLDISRRLGHESYKTTSDTYGHLYKGQDSNIAAQIHNMKLESSTEETDQTE